MVAPPRAAVEAATTVIDWAFAHPGTPEPASPHPGDRGPGPGSHRRPGPGPGLGLQRIEWRAVVGNVGSARAARAPGFQYEGTLRQGLVDSQRRDDGWIAGVLETDERMPHPWPVLEA